MPEFPVNPHRFNPYKSFKFRVKRDGKYVAGVSRISGLRRSTDVVEQRRRRSQLHSQVPRRDSLPAARLGTGSYARHRVRAVGE